MNSSTFFMDRWSVGHGDGAAGVCGWDRRRGHRLLSLLLVSEIVRGGTLDWVDYSFVGRGL